MRPAPILLLIATLAASIDACADTIRLRADEWFPYNGRPGAKPEGYMIDLARVIAAESGDELDYRTTGWEDALDQVRRGDADCAVAAAPAEVEGFALTSEPFGRSVYALFAPRGGDWRFGGAEDLGGRRIGATAGYSYGATMDEWLAAQPEGQVVRVTQSRRALANLFSRLLSGSVDAVIDDEQVGMTLAAEMGITDRIRIAGRAPGSHDLYLACTPADPRGALYARRFSDGLRRLRDSGDLARILAGYGLSDWLAAP